MAEFGFLGLGYDKDGYNKKGYDRQGYDRSGYNKFGFARDGFNRDGYDKDEYDREGYNRQGFNRIGYNKEGFDIHGYNRNGYDIDGFNHDGFDSNGFDRNGYNKDGYDYDGYNRQGFNRYGYDRNGFNANGYDRDGYDCNGYDKNGYNKNGYDLKGYNRKGYNQDGYDREGFDESGFNIEGYNRQGYDKDGYNSLGFNSLGYNRIGRDIWGFDQNGFDENGFDALGFDKAGFDRDGYDKNGFNRQGFNRLGFRAEEFDAQGYHKITRLNVYGQTQQCPSKAEHTELTDSLQNTEIIYDEHGYNANGEPKNRFVINLYLEPSAEHKVTTESKTRVSDLQLGDTVYHKRLGAAEIIHFSKTRFKTYIDVKFVTTNEIMKFAMDDSFFKYLSLSPTKEYLAMQNSYNEGIFNEEKKTLAETISHIQTCLAPIVRKSVADKWTTLSNQSAYKYVGTDGFIKTRRLDYSEQKQSDYEAQITTMRNEPYFARLLYDDTGFYIGKNNVITSNILDWKDPRCQVYYQYQLYIGNKQKNLKLVRDLAITKEKLFGYIDKYDSLMSDTDAEKYADEHLKKIVLANRSNKSIHDIITSIQQNQYAIMTEHKNSNLLVLGCAGSGKTMILLHRLSYLLYNNKDINASDVYIISPTQYLSMESSVLAKTLSLEKTQQWTVRELYKDLLRCYYKNNNVKYKIALDRSFVDDSKIFTAELQSLYSEEYLQSIALRVKNALMLKSNEQIAFITYYRNLISKQISNYISTNPFINELHEKFIALKNKCKDYSEDNLNEMIGKINELKHDEQRLIAITEILQFLIAKACFLYPSSTSLSKEQLERFGDRLEDLLSQTAIYYPKVDLHKYIGNRNTTPKNAVVFLIDCLKSAGMPIDNKWATMLYSYLTNTTLETAKKLLNTNLQKLYDCDAAAVYLEIINKIKNEKWVGFKKKEHAQGYKNFLAEATEIYQVLGWDGNQIGQDFIFRSEICDPFNYMKFYERLLILEKRIANFENGNTNELLFELISYIINDHLTSYEPSIIQSDFELFAHTYICNSLFGAADNNNRYIFIDEFQDLALSEIVTITKAYPKAVLNLYGDTKQCISQKGTKNKSTILAAISDCKEFEINENYRNALEVTQYINAQLDMDMRPIGIHGSVEILNNNLSNFKVAADDRIVYIVKDRNHVDYTLMTKLGVLEGWRGSQATHIPNGAPVALTIQDVKGLEFEVVIIDSVDMTKNEKYVAYTRALNKLYIYNK